MNTFKYKPKFNIGDMLVTPDSETPYYIVGVRWNRVKGTYEYTYISALDMESYYNRRYSAQHDFDFLGMFAYESDLIKKREIIKINGMCNIGDISVSAIELWGYLKDFRLDMNFKHALGAMLHFNTLYELFKTKISLEEFIKACRDIKRETRKARKDAEKQARTEKRIRKHIQKIQESINRICAECKVSKAEFYECVKSIKEKEKKL